MKKVISIILVVLMLMTVLVGCGNNGTESSSNVDLTKYGTAIDRYNAMLTAMLGEEKNIELFKYVACDSVVSSNCTEKGGATVKKEFVFA